MEATLAARFEQMFRCQNEPCDCAAIRTSGAGLDRAHHVSRVVRGYMIWRIETPIGRAIVIRAARRAAQQRLGGVRLGASREGVRQALHICLIQADLPLARHESSNRLNVPVICFLSLRERVAAISAFASSGGGVRGARRETKAPLTPNRISCCVQIYPVCKSIPASPPSPLQIIATV